MQEQDIKFPPSYKFIVGTNDYLVNNKRFPSFTDRILYMSNSGENELVPICYESDHLVKLSDHKPVYA